MSIIRSARGSVKVSSDELHPGRRRHERVPLLRYLARSEDAHRPRHRVSELRPRPACLRAMPPLRPPRPQPVPGAAGRVGDRPGAAELLRLLRAESSDRQGRRRARPGEGGPLEAGQPLPEARPIRPRGFRGRMKIDVLVFGPHPDDAEIAAGGLLLKMKPLGHTTGSIDMTRGEMGWGTPEERGAECDEACAI